MPNPTNPGLVALTLNGSHRMARCWKIVSALGTLRFTDHDVALDIPNDGVYVPGGGVGGSAVQSSAELGSNNVVLRGVITSDLIRASDIAAGHYDGASVTEVCVDHRYPFAGSFREEVYRLGKIRYNAAEGRWDAELVDLLTELNRTTGSRYAKRCDYVLYAPITCKVIKATFTAAFVVTLVNADGTFTAVPTAFDQDAFFEDGEITWTGGQNAGTTQSVRSYSSTTKLWAPHENPFFTIEVGDTASCSAGCNHLSGVNIDGTPDPAGHCKHRFENLANFGGKPAMPTDDVLYDMADGVASP